MALRSPAAKTTHLQEVVVLDSNSDVFGGANDPFGEDFFLAPYADELAERAVRMRHDNRDALRHVVEVLAWEAMDRPELKEAAILLLWNWEDVEVPWIAEAFFLDVRQVCEVAEAHPVRAFNCLCCGKELRVRNRRELFRRIRSLEAACEGAGEEAIADLLCCRCAKQIAEDAETQRRLSHEMHQAILAERGKGPYPERWTTEEWEVMRNRMLARARYRCQLCGARGRNVQLNVHHNSYENYGEERLEDLIVLCRSCHRRFHGIQPDAA